MNDKVIYICADDYGLCSAASSRIQNCIDEGGLNKASIFPNFDKVDIAKISQNKKVYLSLHLNLVEGKCMANPAKVNLLADKCGVFSNTFTGLLFLSLLRKKEFEKQVYKEIQAQVLFWKSILPQDALFFVDSHQHTHIIPSVFSALLQVLKDEKIKPEYIRIPAEPLSPYIKTPSLYLTYNCVNIVKQWLLKFLWFINKQKPDIVQFQTAYFFGILFSGKMDEKRVNKILPKYITLAEKHNKDIEVLLHPGYIQDDEYDYKNTVFKKFYQSDGRKTEFNTAMKISAKEV